jgi:pimeloyl-ACP methyl ester carboxylesterase
MGELRLDQNARKNGFMGASRSSFFRVGEWAGPRGWLAIAAAALLTSGGCALYRAQQDQDLAEAQASVAGSVQALDGYRGPIVVGLFRDESGAKTLAAYFVRYGSGPIRFIVPAGRYHVFAFQDTNGSLGFDPGEATYYVGDTQPPVLLAGGPEHDLGTLRMTQRPLDVTELRMTAERDLASSVELASVNRGTLARWDDPRFEPQEGREGMWTPLQAFTSNGAGLFFLEPYDPNRIPVLFVHGMAGTPRSFRPLAESLDRTRYQAWVFQYPSGIRLDLAAQFLQAMLAEMHARHRYPAYAIVAHSAGGLVSRAALQKIQREGGLLPRAFITLSTPWSGHEAAETGTRRSPVVLRAWLDLAPDSDFLRDLYAAPLRQTPSYLLFGYAGGKGSDGSVTLRSMLRAAAQSEAVRVTGFSETHVSILGSREVAQVVNETLVRELAAGRQR